MDKVSKKRRPFLVIQTIEGTPLKRETPIDPEQYDSDMQKLIDRGLRPPTPFRKG